MAVIAWGPSSARATELAHALGGEARAFFDLGLVDRRLVPVRYAVSLVRTVAYLAARRPRALVTTNPPVVPGLVGWAYGRLTGAPVVLDSHPSAFDPGAHRELARQLPLHRWLTRRVAATLVAGAPVEATVRAWHGTPIVLHDADPGWDAQPARAPAERPRILSAGSFAADEPTAALLDAARLLPDCDVIVTGDLRRCPAELVAAAPSNVRFTGYLHGSAYVAELRAADVVLSLTSRPEAACRAAHEAVYALRPLVTSDHPLARELFSDGVHVANDAASIAAGVRTALARHGELARRADDARARQRARVGAQLGRLRTTLAGSAA